MDTNQSKIIWNPSGDYLNSRIADFMHVHGIDQWQEMINKSCADPEWFWSTFGQFAGIKWHHNYTTILDQSEGMAWSKWFLDGQLNIAYNCLDWQIEKGKHAGVRESVGSDKQAIIWESEAGDSRSLTYGELNTLAGKVAALLTKLGVQSGEAVGIYMPMVPEVVAVLFGCWKLGAVPVPIFSGYGAEALAIRLADAQVKVLFTADGGCRHGKLIDIKKDADITSAKLVKLEKIIVLQHAKNKVVWDKDKNIWWHEALAELDPLPSKQDLPAEHTSLYLYTSGTTGRPKGTVHTHAGILMQVAKELGFGFDTKPDDIFFWLTDIGWMMGPWEMVGCLFWGATMVIYEGAPNYPNPSKLWEIIDKYKVSTLGISPTAIRVLKATGEKWLENHDLSSLRYLGSTGEPWDYESYMWFFEKIGGGRCPIINISGGTEIMGCLLMPLPVMPLYPCSLGGPGLAMDVDVFDETGASVSNTIGYLVCKKPAPSMTKGFLQDKERYIKTYFQRFPRVWYHGDWAKVDENGAWFLFGRSDDTIKVAGKRVGPAEIEAAIMQHEQVAEAAVIGVPHEIKGEAIVCFVVLLPNTKTSDNLIAEIVETIVKNLGAVFRPEKIIFISGLPKTRSGKIVRAAIRKKYLNEPLGDISSVENPSVLDQIMPLNLK